MMRVTKIAVLAAALACAIPARAIENPFHWRGRIAPGRALEIKGVNGVVRAEATSGNEVEVSATKYARRSDPEQVRIEVVEHEGGVTICAVYPSGVGEPNECRPGKGGHMSTHNNDVQVEFTAHVPAGVRFIGRTVNGGVEASLPGSDVEARTVNGSIRISAAAQALAKTVNGGITASLASAKGTAPLDFETVNGGITLDLPGDTGAEVEAQTVNGRLTTDLPMTIQGSFGPRRFSGTIGSGGRKLFLKTVNGDIRLRRTV